MHATPAALIALQRMSRLERVARNCLRTAADSDVLDGTAHMGAQSWIAVVAPSMVETATELI